MGSAGWRAHRQTTVTRPVPAPPLRPPRLLSRLGAVSSRAIQRDRVRLVGRYLLAVEIKVGPERVTELDGHPDLGCRGLLIQRGDGADVAGKQHRAVVGSQLRPGHVPRM